MSEVDKIFIVTQKTECLHFEPLFVYKDEVQAFKYSLLHPKDYIEIYQYNTKENRFVDSRSYIRNGIYYSLYEE
jgi:hypothetical protein